MCVLIRKWKIPASVKWCIFMSIIQRLPLVLNALSPLIVLSLSPSTIYTLSPSFCALQVLIRFEVKSFHNHLGEAEYIGLPNHLLIPLAAVAIVGLFTSFLKIRNAKLKESFRFMFSSSSSSTVVSIRQLSI